MKPLIPHNAAEHKLYQLQAEWRIAPTLVRQVIAQQIQEHPEWNIEIRDHYPQLKSATDQSQEVATETPQKSNLSLLKEFAG